MTERIRTPNLDLEERSLEEAPNGNGYTAVLGKYNLVGAIPEEVYMRLIEKAKSRMEKISDEGIPTPYTLDSIAETYKDWNLTAEMLDEDLKLIMQDGPISNCRTLKEKLNGESQRLEKMLWGFYDEIPDGYSATESRDIEIEREKLPKSVRGNFREYIIDESRRNDKSFRVGEIFILDNNAPVREIYRGKIGIVKQLPPQGKHPLKIEISEFPEISESDRDVLNHVIKNPQEKIPPKIVYKTQKSGNEVCIDADIEIGEDIYKQKLFSVRIKDEKKKIGFWKRLFGKNKKPKEERIRKIAWSSGENTETFCSKISNFRDNDCQKKLREVTLSAYDHLEEALYADVKRREEALEKAE